MHIDRRLLNWGLFFILLGAIPLAVRQGVISTDDVGRWWTLWPLLLVAAGIGLLLSRTPLEFLGGLITAGTLGVMAGALLSTGFAGFGNCGDTQGGTAFQARDGQLSSSATVRLQLNCGTMTVATAAGTGWRLEGEDGDGSGPNVDTSAGNLSIRSDEVAGPFDFLGKHERWTVTLPEGSQLDVDASVNAGTGRVDLGAASLSGARFQVNAGDIRIDLSRTTALGSLRVDVNAGSAKVTLPGRSLSGSLKANAGSVAFCTPAGAGVRIRVNDNITGGNNFSAQGLSKSGSTWETPGYGSAAIQFDLDGEANAGSLNLNPTGGCNA